MRNIPTHDHLGELWRALVSGIGGHHVLRLFKNFGCWTIPSLNTLSSFRKFLQRCLNSYSRRNGQHRSKSKSHPQEDTDAFGCCPGMSVSKTGPCGTGIDRLHILWPTAVPGSACSTYQFLDFVWFVQL